MPQDPCQRSQEDHSDPVAEVSFICFMEMDAKTSSRVHSTTYVYRPRLRGLQLYPCKNLLYSIWYEPKISQLGSGESWFTRSITTCKQQLVRQLVRCFGSGHLGSFLFSQVPRMRSLHRPGAPSTTTTVVLLNRGHFPETSDLLLYLANDCKNTRGFLGRASTVYATSRWEPVRDSISNPSIVS
jgi:hypothetical protein